MSIRWFKTFLAVADCGSFAGAANRVGLTQAAVSIQMSALEDDLRIKLFDRGGRTVVLNTAGRGLLPRAMNLMTLYDNIASNLDDCFLDGVLALGAIPPTFAKPLPDALSLMRDRHPRVIVRVSTGVSSELAYKVERGELDAALVAQSPHKLARNLMWDAIQAEPLVLLTPAAVRITTLRKTLFEQPFIGISQASWTGRLIYNTLRYHHIKVSWAMELDSLETIGAMVARGFGVSIMPLSPSHWDLDPRVNITLLRNPSVVRRIGLIRRQGQSRDSLISALQTCLAASSKEKIPKVPSVSLSREEARQE